MYIVGEDKSGWAIASEGKIGKYDNKALVFLLQNHVLLQYILDFVVSDISSSFMKPKAIYYFISLSSCLLLILWSSILILDELHFKDSKIHRLFWHD